MKKILYIIASLICFATVANAQAINDSLVRDINIVRTFIPVIRDAGKINTFPEVEKSNVMAPKDVQYITWIAPIIPEIELQTLPHATLKRMQDPKFYRKGYAKIGAGNYNSFLGDFYVPILNGQTYRLDLLANHLSSSGKVRLDNDSKVKAENMINTAQLLYAQNFFNFNLFSDLRFSRRDFNYYGLDNILYKEDFPKNDAQNFFDFKLGVASRPRVDGIKYLVSSKYEMTSTNSGLTENHLITRAMLGIKWGDAEVALNVGMSNLFYKQDPKPTEVLFRNITDELDSYSVLEFSPHYAITHDIWNLKLGFKTFLSFGKGKTFCPAPDIMGQITLIHGFSHLYAHVTGDLKINSMRSIFTENQYFKPDLHIADTYTPLDATLGIKVKMFEHLIFNGYAGYKHIDNQYFFINYRPNENAGYYANLFDVVTDRAGLLNTGASFTYNLENKVSVLLKGAYYNWILSDLDYAWHKPDWEIVFDVAYNLNNDIRLSANLFALGKRQVLGYDGAVALKPIFDLSLSGTYEYTSWLAFFLNANNVFAQSYQMWYGYNTQQFNIMGGAIFSF